MNDRATIIGDPADRVDGKAKVTGAARYAAEYHTGDGLYGVLVTSTIAKGRITALDAARAQKAPGVVAVISHLNRPDVPGWMKQKDEKDKRLAGQEFRVFFDDKIYYNHQPVALVIADTLERAADAATLVQVSYAKEKHNTDLMAGLSQKRKPKRSEDYQRTGNGEKGTVTIDAEYHTSFQIHNPMEMHAATAVWTGDALKVYNKTQASKLAQKDIMSAFELPEDKVEIQSPYVGGAFGSSSRVWPQEMAAILGAKKTGRMVTVMAKRDQQFNMVGYRPYSYQTIKLEATADGRLTAIAHQAVGSTSTYEEFNERILDCTKSLYACPSVQTKYELVPLDMSTPCWTRGPGETSGSFALESAMDELSYALKMGPLELRLKNFADKDPENDKPWSSNSLKECYEKGAEKFGWSKRNPVPRSMKEKGWLTGMGMAAGIYHASRSPAAARATFFDNGKLVVETSVADVGPGSATIMTQIAADAFGIDMAQVEFKYGNSQLPPAPGQFGSQTTASVGAAVHEVVKELSEKIKAMSTAKNVNYADVLHEQHLPQVSITKQSNPGTVHEQFSGKSFVAHFAELQVHESTGVIKIKRTVSAIDAGKIVNLKTATSQAYGAITWGIGIALMEQGIIDHRFGRYVNNNLADYHVPVNADIPQVDIIFTDKPDPVLDPLGTKGLGEIGLVGFTAAIANAVYHATGKRIRSLPVTIDKIIG